VVEFVTTIVPRRRAEALIQGCVCWVTLVGTRIDTGIDTFDMCTILVSGGPILGRRAAFAVTTVHFTTVGGVPCR